MNESEHDIIKFSISSSNLIIEKQKHNYCKYISSRRICGLL